MAGGGQHLQAIGPALGVGAPVDGLEEHLEGARHLFVRVVVVVAVLVGLVHQPLAQGLLPLEVGIQDLDEGRQGQVPPVEGQFLQGREAVRDAADAHGLDEAVVVAGAAGVVVPALGDAVVGDDGEEGVRHAPGVEALDDLVAPDLDVQEVADLGLEGREELVRGLEPGGVAGLRADLLLGAGVEPVVQRQLQHLHQVEVAREDVGLLAEGAHLHAAGAAPFPRVLQRLALAELLLHHGVRIEERRETVAIADDLQGMLQHPVRCPARPACCCWAAADASRR